MEIRPILSALLRSKTGAMLVAVQVALTLAIVANALFVVQTRLATAARPTGADEANLFQLLYLGTRTIDDRAAMVQRDLELLQAIPGVAAASPANQLPLAQMGWGLRLYLDPDRVDGPGRASFDGAAYFSGSSLVDTLGLAVIAGRDFLPEEIREVDARAGEPRGDTIILTRHLAERMFGEPAAAIGKSVYIAPLASTDPVRVVGVVDQLMTPWGQTSADAYASFILPVRYLSDMAHYAVRAAPGQRDRVMAEAEKALGAARTDRVLIHNRSMTQIRANRYRHERAGASLLVAVTVGLLLVTASGIVGVASLWVTQRRKQIGVRRALGATRLDILRYFVTENLLITAGGVTAGIALAFGLNLFLVSKLEMARLPLGYLVAGVIVLVALGVLAVLGPAWRAAAVPPAVATRST